MFIFDRGYGVCCVDDVLLQLCSVCVHVARVDSFLQISSGPRCPDYSRSVARNATGLIMRTDVGDDGDGDADADTAFLQRNESVDSESSTAFSS